MGCCILGALIISRWLYAVRRMRLSLASLHRGVTGIVMTLAAGRRPVLMAACVAIEIGLLATVAGHELNGHLRGVPSHEAGAIAGSTIALTAMDAICSQSP
jgi:hypothetical protein